MTSFLRDLTFGEFLHKVRHRVLPNLGAMRHSRIRKCRCCEHWSVILALGTADEFKVCLRCKANLRYEMLASHLRERYPDLETMTVLELDPASPLRELLGRAARYIRSFYREHIPPGTVREDGAVCQDVMRLTCADGSLDLIVSSDVLEHVPDPQAAFRETARTLKVGGAHLFTVPPRDDTRRRARIAPEGLELLVEPAEYHLDPLDKKGVLVFWDYGPDLAQHFPVPGLEYAIVAGPLGESRRTVWAATKVS